MKSIATALAAGVLVVAAQSAVADAFPQESQQYLFGPTQSTYADTHPVTSTNSVFPAEYRPEGWRGLPPQSTYSDAHRGDPVRSAGSAFPAGEPEGWGGLPAQSTYADTHLTDPARVAQPAQDQEGITSAE